MRHSICFHFLAFALCGLAELLAQPRFGGPQGAGNSMRGRFMEEAPAVGDRLPDITACDDRGKPFPLSALKGHYTVLVFGCLT